MIDRGLIHLALENARQTVALSPVPPDKWPQRPAGLVEVWRNQRFLVQIYHDNGYERMSVIRSSRNDGEWADGITWDELQQLKRECGRGDAWAVEIYPAERHVVNVANMRHLWILPKPPQYGWRNR